MRQAVDTDVADHAITLSDERLLLRAFRAEDDEVIYQAVRESMAELGQWLSWCHGAYSIEDTRQFLAGRGDAFRDEGEHGFAIFERANGRFVGATGINQLDSAALRANLGYWLRTSATGQGFASRATKIVARWALGSFGLERVEIVAAVGNCASQRVAERVGATRETVARKRLRVHGVQHDAVVYSLTREDVQRWTAP